MAVPAKKKAEPHPAEIMITNHFPGVMLRQPSHVKAQSRVMELHGSSAKEKEKEKGKVRRKVIPEHDLCLL